MRIGAGDLKHCIKILKKAQAAPNTYGGENINWQLFKTAKAHINTKPGNEKYTQVEEIGVVNVVITTRYITGIERQMRIEANGKTFEIVNIQNIKEENRWLEMKCQEVIA